jgi:hypothetical protein
MLVDFVLSVFLATPLTLLQDATWPSGPCMMAVHVVPMCPAFRSVVVAEDKRGVRVFAVGNVPLGSV